MTWDGSQVLKFDGTRALLPDGSRDISGECCCECFRTALGGGADVSSSGTPPPAVTPPSGSFTFGVLESSLQGDGYCVIGSGTDPHAPWNFVEVLYFGGGADDYQVNAVGPNVDSWFSYTGPVARTSGGRFTGTYTLVSGYDGLYTITVTLT